MQNSIYRLYYLGFFVSLLKNMQRAGEEPNLTYAEMFKRLIVIFALFRYSMKWSKVEV